MVSWGDSEESSEALSSASTESITTTYDSEFSGDAPVLCKHNEVAGKFVAYEGTWTGRSVYACKGQEGGTCDFVQWVDDEWPSPMQKILVRLWEQYAQVKEGRINDALDNTERKWEMKDELEKVHRCLKDAQDELKKEVDEKHKILALKAKAEQALIEARNEIEQKKMLDAATCNMHKFLLKKAEKDRDKFKEDKRKLECIVADFLKQEEQTKAETRAKFQKIKGILDE